MYQRDYILRMIEEVTKAVATRLLALKKEDKQEAQYVINELLGRLYMPKLELLQSLSTDKIIGLTSNRGEPDLGRAVGAAVLLKKAGEIYEATGQPDESYFNYVKSLQLFMHCHKSSDRENVPTDIIAEIKELLMHLKLYALPPEINKALLQFHEDTGDYAEAENILFELQQSHPDEIANHGVLFYKRLLKLSDAQLESGNLPRAEVYQGLEELLRSKP